MKYFAWLCLAACWFLLNSPLHAQQFGGFPASTKWKQINTDTVRIIFTAGAEGQAARIATLIHKAASDTPFSIGSQLRKVNIVLHSHTTLANGYVALAPFRSEFYLVPSSNVFDFGNLPWQENLAIHEYRHVQQYNNFRHGPGKAFYYLFGEQGLAFANALAIPDWFFEGDAVHSETALTTQGRGRLSYFLSSYRSLWREGRNYSWMKLRNGSLKDYVPDHYRLGYLLTNYGYLKYGDDFWKKVTTDAADFKGLFYPFQKAVKKYAGVDYKTFRKEAFDFYKKELPSNEKTPTHRETVTDYFFPQFIGTDSLLYLKSAYNKIPAFYISDNTGEHRIAQRSISAEEWFGYRNGTIAYTAYSTDARRSLIDYSDIVLLDINSGHERRITKKEKYYTPDLSPTAEKLVAVRINGTLQTELQVLDRDGRVLQTVRPENDEYFTNPRFLDEHTIVAGVRTPDSKMSLQSFDLNTARWTVLIPYSYHSISLPYVQRDTIYFTANFYGNDDVYAYAIPSKKIYRLQHDYTGMYYPSVRGDSLVFSLFTSNGLRMKTVSLKNIVSTIVDEDVFQQLPMIYPVAGEKHVMPVRTERFAVKRYDKSTGLFNFHSWAPNYSDPEFTFSLYGDNILNTFSNELYYRYNQNESSHGIGWNASYGGFYPQLNVGTEYTFNRTDRLQNRIITYDQFEASAGYNIPLSFSRGKTYRFLNFGTNFVFNRSIPTGFFKDSLRSSSSTYLHHFLGWSQYLPRAVQHIYPRLGYTLSAAHRHYLNSKGFQFLSTAQLFLPSFGNHSIVLAASIQETKADTNSVIFPNRFANSRGYADRYFVRMWKLSGNYHFPIFYPDFGVGSIVYLQRLRGNIFYDFNKVYSFAKQPLKNLRSVGGELYFDTKWWNQQPVTFGIRVSHLLDNGFTIGDRRGSNFFEFILPVNLIPN